MAVSKAFSGVTSGDQKKHRNPDLLAIFFIPKNNLGWNSCFSQKKKLKVEKSGMSFTMIRVENLEKIIFGNFSNWLQESGSCDDFSQSPQRSQKAAKPYPIPKDAFFFFRPTKKGFGSVQPFFLIKVLLNVLVKLFFFSKNKSLQISKVIQPWKGLNHGWKCFLFFFDVFVFGMIFASSRSWFFFIWRDVDRSCWVMLGDWWEMCWVMKSKNNWSSPN